MSLARRLFLAFSFLVCCILMINLWLNFKSSERYLSEQLGSLAQDTATSLGLTISHAANDGDPAIIQAMINVIFDRGYYASILYSNADTNVVASRSTRTDVKGVPRWFSQWANLPMHIGRADVVSGWQQLGEISVVVDSSPAYQDLWRSFKSQLWLFFFSLVLLYLLVGQAVKFILRPLTQVEEQAQALIDKRFITQLVLPSTPELKRVVIAMNTMVEKVRDMFSMQVETISDLRVNVATDKLTGLLNKSEFDARVNTWLRTEASAGGCALIFVRVNDLKGINDHYGLDAADQWLRDVAMHLHKQANNTDKVFLARRSGGDFSLFLSGCDYTHAQRLCDDILDFPLIEQDTESKRVLYVGAVAFACGIKLSQMLSAVDASLRKAQLKPISNAYVDLYDPQSIVLPVNQWREKLERVLEREELLFYVQSVISSKDSNVLYYEVLARIKTDAKIINAGVFWPLVERFGLQVEFDRLVIKQVLVYLDKLTKRPSCFGVNISCASLHDQDFLNWLEKTVLRSDSAEYLIFEISEVALNNQDINFKRFIHLIDQSASRLALGGFGLMPSSLGCLQSVPFDFVKVDQRFIVDIDKNGQNQFYTKNLVNIAKSCDIKIIAHGVETNNQWEVLKVFGFDAGQGYYLNSPCLPN